jgi:hypothetical protein
MSPLDRVESQINPVNIFANKKKFILKDGKCRTLT